MSGESETEIRAHSAQEKALSTLKEASEVGFDMKTPIGQKFARSAEAKSEEYKSLQGQDAKRAFRKAWAAHEHKKAVLVFERRTSFKSVDMRTGTYLPPGRIVKEDGGKGEASNIEAAWRHIHKCIQLGGKFVKWNGFTERHEFLYFRTQTKQIFEEASCWCMWRPGDDIESP